MKAYAIKAPDGMIIIESARASELVCTDEYTLTTIGSWNWLESQGFVCVPIEINEIDMFYNLEEQKKRNELIGFPTSKTSEILYTEISDKQKLQALADRFYQGITWEPKKGDYYTSSRADNELYKIIDEDEDSFYTVYCNQKSSLPTRWYKNDFMIGFFEKRVYVRIEILQSIKN